MLIYLNLLYAIVRTNLWKSSIVPDVAMMRETVMYEAQLSFLRVLFDGIQPLHGRYLKHAHW